MEPERMIRAITKAIGILFEWILIGMFVGALILLACVSLKGQCPNDFCATALEISCTPTYFENHDCTDEELCINPHPGTGSCNYDYQSYSHWYTFTLDEFTLIHLILNTNYQSEMEGWNTCLPMFEGSTWALMTGTCDDIEYITNSIGINSAQKCWCPGNDPYPTGPGVWAGPCSGPAPCSDPLHIQPYWYNNGGQYFPLGIDQYTPYTPCHQNHSAVLPLWPGTYYIQVTGVGLSLGDGSIQVCPQVPLSTPPILEVEGTELHWTGETTGVFYIEQLDIYTSQWHKIGATEFHTWPLTSGGYYRVLNEYGTSNPVHVPPIVKASGGVIYNVLGQEHAKFGIKR